MIRPSFIQTITSFTIISHLICSNFSSITAYHATSNTDEQVNFLNSKPTVYITQDQAQQMYNEKNGITSTTTSTTTTTTPVRIDGNSRKNAYCASDLWETPLDPSLWGNSTPVTTPYCKFGHSHANGTSLAARGNCLGDESGEKYVLYPCICIGEEQAIDLFWKLGGNSSLNVGIVLIVIGFILFLIILIPKGNFVKDIVLYEVEVDENGVF